MCDASLCCLHEKRWGLTGGLANESLGCRVNVLSEGWVPLHDCLRSRSALQLKSAVRRHCVGENSDAVARRVWDCVTSTEMRVRTDVSCLLNGGDYLSEANFCLDLACRQIEKSAVV